MIRKTIALGLIVGSLLFASLILFAGKSKIVTDSRYQKPQIAKENYIPSLKTISDNKNATEITIKELASEISKTKPSEIGNINPEKLVDDLIAKQIEDMDLSEFSPEINLEDLKIVKSFDKRVAENYLKNFYVILKNNFSKVSFDASKPSVSDFQSLASAYKKTIGEFYSLVVPENLAFVHQEEIRLLTIQKNIFTNLGGYQNDPLKAIISVQLLEETNRQFSELKKAIVEFRKENNINI